MSEPKVRANSLSANKSQSKLKTLCPLLLINIEQKKDNVIPVKRTKKQHKGGSLLWTANQPLILLFFFFLTSITLSDFYSLFVTMNKGCWLFDQLHDVLLVTTNKYLTSTLTRRQLILKIKFFLKLILRNVFENKFIFWEMFLKRLYG